MQTIEEYKAYTKQLEEEVGKWHDAFDASQKHIEILMAENRELKNQLNKENGNEDLAH